MVPRYKWERDISGDCHEPKSGSISTGLPTSTELPYSGTEMGFPVREYGQRAKSTEIKKLPTWFQLPFCLYLTPTQIIYWSGHEGVTSLLITSGLKWLKHNPHYHKNNKPQDLIQLPCAPVRPITFDTGGSHVLKQCDWSSSQFAWDSSAFRPMKTSLI